MRRNPLVPVALLFAAGIIVGYYSVGSLMWPCVFAVAALLSFLFRCRLLCAAALVVAIGDLALIVGLPRQVDVDRLNDESLWMTGNVENVEEHSVSTSLLVETGSPKFRCQIVTPQLFEAEIGDMVRFRGRFAEPVSRTDLPDEHTSDLLLRAERVSAVCFVLPDSMRVVGRTDGLMTSIRRLREKVVCVVVSGPLNDNCSGFLSALLAGDTSMIPTSMRREFASAGIAHVLALSGMHVGFIAVVVTLLLFPMTMMGYRRVRWVVAIVMLWIYALLTGLSPSVVRAVIMASVVAAGFLLQRDVYPVNSLALAAIVILIIWPLSLFMAGFQLSFLAVIGILSFSRPLTELCAPASRIARTLILYMTVSIGAVLGSGPLSAYHFHQFPVLFLVANIPITLILPVFVGGGILYVVLGAFGFYPAWLSAALNLLFGVIEWIASGVSGISALRLDGLYFSAWLLVPMYASIGSLWLWLTTRRHVYGLSSVILLLFTVALRWAITPTYSPYEAYVIRNNYHTSLMVRNGSSASIFTTVPAASIGIIEESIERRYADYLGRRGVENADVRTVRSGQTLRLGEKRVYFLYSSVPAPDTIPRPTYLFVCRGFKDDILKAAESIRPDTVVLGYDLDVRRHNRYTAELTAAGVPFRSIRGEVDGSRFGNIQF